MRRGLAAAATALLLSGGEPVEAAFIANGGFETVPGTGPAFQGQGLLPTGWQSVTSTPDTYSNDGSYGLLPEGFGNFPGAKAFDGLRWVGGAAFGRMAASTTVGGESFGTTLVTALTPRKAYLLETCLYQALRVDLDHPGGYHLFLATKNTPTGVAQAVLLGRLAPTSEVERTEQDLHAWQARSLTFTAPADAGSRPFLIFSPYQASSGNSYPGIDAVSLTAQPAAVRQTCSGAAMPTATATPTPVQTPAAPGSSPLLWLLSSGCIVLTALAHRIRGR